jgi:SAM-dependent methyltransferase
MPTVEQNLLTWDGAYHWQDDGEEWSSRWGGSEAQWYGAILPRIHPFLPAERILEIAPGYGRWTQYLKSSCRRLDIVDLSPKCIDACRARFAADEHIHYHVNDGTSLAMIDDQSIDFVFSFDSLVHCEEDVIGAYLRELLTKLKPDGVGLIHHSNGGQYRMSLSASSKMPVLLRRGLTRSRLLDRQQGRALSMTARRFEELAEQAGLACISQELVNWSSRRLIDCLSVFTPRGSRWARPNRVIRNPHFMCEAGLIRRMASVYSPAR